MAWYNPYSWARAAYKNVVKPIGEQVAEKIGQGWDKLGELGGEVIKHVFGEEAKKLMLEVWTSAKPEDLGDYMELTFERLEDTESLFRGDFQGVLERSATSGLNVGIDSIQSASKFSAWAGEYASKLDKITGGLLLSELKKIFTSFDEPLPDLSNATIDPKVREILSNVINKFSIVDSVELLEKIAVDQNTTFAFGFFFDGTHGKDNISASAGIFCDNLGDWGYFGDIDVSTLKERLLQNIGDRQYGYANTDANHTSDGLSFDAHIYMVEGGRNIFKNLVSLQIKLSGKEIFPIYEKSENFGFVFKGVRFSYSKGFAVLENSESIAINYTTQKIGEQDLELVSAVSTYAKIEPDEKHDEDFIASSLKGAGRAVFIVSQDQEYISVASGKLYFPLKEPGLGSALQFIPSAGHPNQAYIVAQNGNFIDFKGADANGKFYYDLSENPVLNIFESKDIFYSFHTQVISPFSSKYKFTVIPIERKMIGLRLNDKTTNLFVSGELNGNPLVLTESASLSNNIVVIKLGSGKVFLQINNPGSDFHGCYLKFHQQISGDSILIDSSGEIPSDQHMFKFDKREQGMLIYHQNNIGTYYLSIGDDRIIPGDGIHNLAFFQIIDLKGKRVGLMPKSTEKEFYDIPLFQSLKYNLMHYDHFHFSSGKGGLQLISVGKNSNGQEEFTFTGSDFSMNTNTSNKWKHFKFLFTKDLADAESRFVIESDGDYTLFKNEATNTYLSFEPDGKFYKVIRSTAKQKWSVIDMEGKFSGIKLSKSGHFLCMNNNETFGYLAKATSQTDKRMKLFAIVDLKHQFIEDGVTCKMIALIEPFGRFVNSEGTNEELIPQSRFKLKPNSSYRGFHLIDNNGDKIFVNDSNLVKPGNQDQVTLENSNFEFGNPID